MKITSEDKAHPIKSTIHVLKKRSDFLYIREKGGQIRIGKNLIVAYLQHRDRHRLGLPSRFGWTIPNSTAHAVLRNKMKRWLRVFLMKVVPPSGFQHQAVDVHFIFLRGNNPDHYRNMSHEDFDRHLQKAWNRLVEIVASPSRRHVAVAEQSPDPSLQGNRKSAVRR